MCSLSGYGVLKLTAESGSDSGLVASGVSRVMASSPSSAILRSMRISDPAWIVWCPDVVATIFCEPGMVLQQDRQFPVAGAARYAGILYG